MVVNNFQMLQQYRLRNQPTSALGMSRVARSLGQAALTGPAGMPNTNTGPMAPPQVSQGNKFPGLPTQTGMPQAGFPSFRPPPNVANLGSPSQPGSGTPWQQQGVAHTLADAAGGRYYQDGTTWYSNTPPPRPITTQPVRDLTATQPQLGGSMLPNLKFGTPTTTGVYGGPTLGNISAGPGGEVTAAGPKQSGPVGAGGSGGGQSGGTDAQKPGRRSQKSSKGPDQPVTGTSGQGLAPAGSGNTNDQVGNAVDLSNPANIGVGGPNGQPNSSGIENLQDLANAYGYDASELMNLTNQGWSFSVSGDGTVYINGTDASGHYTAQPYTPGMQLPPGKNWKDAKNAESSGDQAPTTIEEWMAKYGLGQPPQFDQAAVDRLNAATNANYMRQQGRSLQAQTEMQARAGASADQMAGAMGDVTSAYGLQSAQEQARNNVQLQVQNFQQQADYYNKQFQIGMSLFADAQSDQDREFAFKYAQRMLQLGEASQKRLIEYQNELQNQIGWKDILGMLLGAGTQVGSAALGGYMAAPAAGAAGVTSYLSGPGGTRGTPYQSQPLRGY